MAICQIKQTWFIGVVASRLVCSQYTSIYMAGQGRSWISDISAARTKVSVMVICPTSKCTSSFINCVWLNIFKHKINKDKTLNMWKCQHFSQFFLQSFLIYLFLLLLWKIWINWQQWCPWIQKTLIFGTLNLLIIDNRVEKNKIKKCRCS